MFTSLIIVVCCFIGAVGAAFTNQSRYWRTALIALAMLVCIAEVFKGTVSMGLIGNPNGLFVGEQFKVVSAVATQDSTVMLLIDKHGIIYSCEFPKSMPIPSTTDCKVIQDETGYVLQGY